MSHSHISAEVEWLSTSDGGRRSPIFTGYRGQFHLHGDDEFAEVKYTLPVESVGPSETTTCEIRFGRPESHLPRITVGDYFEVREGARVVGRGKITTFLDADAC